MGVIIYNFNLNISRKMSYGVLECGRKGNTMGVRIYSFNLNISPKMSYGILECDTVMLQNYMLMIL